MTGENIEEGRCLPEFPDWEKEKSETKRLFQELKTILFASDYNCWTTEAAVVGIPLLQYFFFLF